MRNALRALAAALLACAACSCTEEPAARPADAAAAGGGGAADAAIDTPASGGGAGTGDSGADSGGLITDPITGQAIWRPVEPPLGPCEVYVADVDPDPFPKRVWSDCGTGCKITPVPWPIPETQGTAFTAEVAGDDLLVRTSHRFAESGFSGQFFFSLATGRHFAAIRNRPCLSPGQGPFTGTTYALAYLPERLLWLARVSPSDGAITWWPPLVWPDPDVAFAWNGGMVLGAGNLWWLDSPTDTTPELVDPKGDGYATGDGDAFVYLGVANGRGEVRIFTRETGVRTLYTPPQPFLLRTSLGDELIAWITGETYGEVIDPRLWWARRTTDPAKFVVEGGLSLEPGAAFGYTVGTHGAWVAITSYLPTRMVFIVEASSKRMWRLRPLQGYEWDYVKAVGARTLLMEAYDVGASGSSYSKMVTITLDPDTLTTLEAELEAAWSAAQ